MLSPMVLLDHRDHARRRLAQSPRRLIFFFLHTVERFTLRRRHVHSTLALRQFRNHVPHLVSAPQTKRSSITRSFKLRESAVSRCQFLLSPTHFHRVQTYPGLRKFDVRTAAHSQHVHHKAKMPLSPEPTWRSMDASTTVKKHPVSNLLRHRR